MTCLPLNSLETPRASTVPAEALSCSVTDRPLRECRTLQMVVDVVRYVDRVLERRSRYLRVAPTKGMVGDRPEVDYRRLLILQTASLRPLDTRW